MTEIPRNRVRQGELLAGMIEHQDLAEKGIQKLQDRHFTTAKAKSLFRAIQAVLGASESVSMATVKEYAGDSVSFTDISNVVGLNICPTQWNFLLDKHLEEHMREDAQKTVLEYSQKLAQVGDLADTMQIVAELQDRLIGLSAQSDSETASETPAQAIRREIEHIRKHGYPKRYKLNYERFQQISGGFGAGSFVILGARPSVGKSTMAMNWIYCLELSSIPMLFLSYEMTNTDLSRSLIRIASGKPLDDEATVQDLEAGEKFLTKMNIRLEQCHGATSATLSARIRQIHRKSPIGMVFIDHLARIREDKGKTRYEETTNISNDLADLAHSTGIVIVCLAQLNRAVEGGAERRPRMSDLRESGAIEQDADKIILLSNEDARKGGNYDMPTVIAEVVKNRTGRTGMVKFVFNKMTSTFQEISE